MSNDHYMACCSLKSKYSLQKNFSNWIYMLGSNIFPIFQENGLSEKKKKCVVASKGIDVLFSPHFEF